VKPPPPAWYFSLMLVCAECGKPIEDGRATWSEPTNPATDATQAPVVIDP
jgi:hypothetical protein